MPWKDKTDPNEVRSPFLSLGATVCSVSALSPNWHYWPTAILSGTKKKGKSRVALLLHHVRGSAWQCVGEGPVEHNGTTHGTRSNAAREADCFYCCRFLPLED